MNIFDLAILKKLVGSGGLSIKKIEFTDRPTAYAWLVENYLSVTRCVLRTNTSEYPFIYDSVDLAGDAIRFTKINFGIGGSDQVYHGYFLLAFTPTETKVTLTAAEIDFRSDGTITIGNNEVTALTDDYWSVVDASIEIYYMG